MVGKTVLYNQVLYSDDLGLVYCGTDHILQVLLKSGQEPDA